jgi:urea transport system substrate-binding protein
MVSNTHAVSENHASTNRFFNIVADRKRGALAWIIFIALGALAWFAIDRVLVDRSPIVVGILHSQTGPMAISEKSMIDAEVLALEQINAAGGLLGRPVQWVIADGASDPATFATQAEKLIARTTCAWSLAVGPAPAVKACCPCLKAMTIC